MTKENSILLKGVAILMMLFLHCFNVGIHPAIRYDDIVLFGYPLCDIIARCASPVDLYVLLSGYGLYYKYTNDKHIFVINRLLKLYALYWLTLIVFVPLLYLKNGNIGSLADIVMNLIGYKASYNATIWFLFPYGLLMSCSNSLFYLLNKYPRRMLMASLIISVFGYGLSWLGIHNFVNFGYKYLAQFINSLGMLLPFILGAYINKENLIGNVRQKVEDKQNLLLLAFATATILRCVTEFSFMVHLVYTICIVFFFCVARIPSNVRKILVLFGKLSTVVWFIHAYFLWYLLSDFFYGLKYPPFIFLAIIVCSFVCGGAINIVYQKVIKKI